MNQKLIPYFLGELSEEEQLRIETEFFADETKFAEFEAEQNDFIDAYVRGRLSAAQTERFTEHLQGSPGLRRRVEVAELLAARVAREQPAVPPSANLLAFRPALPPATAVQSSQPSRQWSGWRYVAAGFFLMVAGMGWMVWTIRNLNHQLEFARRQASRATSPREVEELRQQLAAGQAHQRNLAEQLAGAETRRHELEAQLARVQPPAAEPVLAFALTPILVREGGGPQQLNLPAKPVQIRFQVPVSALKYQVFRVQIETVGGDSVWTSKLLTARGNGPKRTVPATLRSTLLQTGEYIVKLLAKTEPGGFVDVAEFAVTVARKD